MLALQHCTLFGCTLGTQWGKGSCFNLDQCINKEGMEAIVELGIMHMQLTPRPPPSSAPHVCLSTPTGYAGSQSHHAEQHQEPENSKDKHGIRCQTETVTRGRQTLVR